jgi:hypothetical protein
MVVFSLYLNLDIINFMVGLYELFTKKAGIEKRALNTAQLISMAQNFARRGKLDRFETLLENRARAIPKVLESRSNLVENLIPRAYQELDLLGTVVGPEQLKYEKAFFRRPLDSMTRIAKDVPRDTFDAGRLYAPYPVRDAFLEPLIDTVRKLRKHSPGELEKINSPAVRKAEADKWIQEFRSL